jgi:hypothetical protein
MTRIDRLIETADINKIGKFDELEIRLIRAGN